MANGFVAVDHGHEACHGRGVGIWQVRVAQHRADEYFQLGDIDQYRIVILNHDPPISARACHRVSRSLEYPSAAMQSWREEATNLGVGRHTVQYPFFWRAYQIDMIKSAPRIVPLGSAGRVSQRRVPANSYLTQRMAKLAAITYSKKRFKGFWRIEIL